jgi:nucleoside-diphosphate-sugar epimerase
VTPTLITGSSGFIASHLRPALGHGAATLDKQGPADFPADIRDLPVLQNIARSFVPEAVVHLAALCEVVTPWASVGDLLSTNVEGTYNVLRAFQPRLFVFASSGSVYGNGVPPATAPCKDSVRPLSAYGTSKATGEVLCRLACHEHGIAAVAFRLANVIGEGCRGLIGHLVEHACRYPDGDHPVRLRGAGRMVRDFVPVNYVVRSIVAALSKEWDPGLRVFNVASGFAMTNSEVFEVVLAALKRHGLAIHPHWGPSPAFGEAQHIVLDPDSGIEGPDFVPPTRQEIELAIEASVDAGVQRHRATMVASAADERRL